VLQVAAHFHDTGDLGFMLDDGTCGKSTKEHGYQMGGIHWACKEL
jgi:hypothetical protein